MSIRWIAPLAIVALLLAVSCTQQAGPGDAGDMAGVYPAVPFGAFLTSVASASYRQYAGRPGARVRDQQAFDEMRSYLLARYHGARAVRSYTAAGIMFDCLAQNGSSVPPPAGAPSIHTGSSASGAPAAQKGTCPDGSVPVRRTTLEELVRFPTLRQYLAKSPGGSGALPPT